MYSARVNTPQLEKDLQAALWEHYGMESIQSRDGLRGFYGEIWEARRGDARYIVKLDRSPKHQMVLHRNLPILPHLWKHGVRCLAQVVETKEGRLSLTFADGVLVVFTHLPGTLVGEEGHALMFDAMARIYDVPPPAFLWHETFTNRIEREVALYITSLSTFPHEAARSLSAFLRTKIPLISRYAARLQYFSARCEKERDGFVITHGDPRRNTLVEGEHAGVIDWDDPLYAPPERDAWLFLDRREDLRLFEEALARHGMEYHFRVERLAFYCYYMFFQYLRESLSCFFDMQGEIDPWVVEQTVRAYFKCPVMESLYIVADWL